MRVVAGIHLLDLIFDVGGTAVESWHLDRSGRVALLFILVLFGYTLMQKQFLLIARGDTAGKFQICDAVKEP